MEIVDIDFNNLVETPGVLIAIERVSVSILGDTLAHQCRVKFVLDTTLNQHNEMTGYLLDQNNIRLSYNNFSFQRIDEWFALKNYLVRNGISKQSA